MALYLGNSKVKVNINGVAYRFNLYADPPITNGLRLLTSEDFVIKDVNGVYITVIPNVPFTTSDGYIFKDANGEYFMVGGID